MDEKSVGKQCVRGRIGIRTGHTASIIVAKARAFAETHYSIEKSKKYYLQNTEKDGYMVHCRCKLKRIVTGFLRKPQKKCVRL